MLAWLIFLKLSLFGPFDFTFYLLIVIILLGALCFHETNDIVTDEGPSVDYVIENWKTQKLQMDSDLMSSSWNGVAFN